MRPAPLLGLAAALAMGTPAGAASGSVRILWVELCDAAHPGRRIPLPIRDDGAPSKACHAACGVWPEPRSRRN